MNQSSKDPFTMFETPVRSSKTMKQCSETHFVIFGWFKEVISWSVRGISVICSQFYYLVVVPILYSSHILWLQALQVYVRGTLVHVLKLRFSAKKRNKQMSILLLPGCSIMWIMGHSSRYAIMGLNVWSIAYVACWCWWCWVIVLFGDGLTVGLTLLYLFVASLPVRWRP